MASAEYDIKDSLPRVGYLYPILKDAYGNVIDGVHRLQLDPKWPVKKLDHITDPVQLAIARLVANVCRRDVPAEEKTEWLRQIASMTGWSPKEIAEHLPVTYDWVIKYFPQELKNKEKAIAGAKGGEARAEAYRESEDFARRRQPKSQDTRQWVPCEGEGCNILTKATPEHIHKGKVLCSRCHAKAVGKPEAPQRAVRQFDVVETSAEREIPESEPEPKWRATVSMKKPYTVEGPIKPTEDDVLEAFGDAVRSSEIDDLFDINIEEISKDELARSTAS